MGHPTSRVEPKDVAKKCAYHGRMHGVEDCDLWHGQSWEDQVYYGGPRSPCLGSSGTWHANHGKYLDLSGVVSENLP